MKLHISDDHDRMMKRLVFEVEHQEIVEYGAGLPRNSFRHGEGVVSAALLLLMRIYVAESRGTEDADLRVRMHEMRDSLRAGEGSLQEGQESAVPGLLPPGEEDILDAEFTDEPGDGAEEEA